jgi:hypothetical protein
MKSKKITIIIIIFLVLLIVGGAGGYYAYQSYLHRPESAVDKEFKLIKQLDKETIRQYVSYENLYGVESVKGESAEISDTIIEVFELFFKDFDYKIIDSKIVNQAYAFVTVNLTTVDAKAVAKEYLKHILAYSMTNNLKEIGSSKESTSFFYTILRDILRDGNFGTVQTEVTLKLINKNNNWTLQTNQEIENDLVGGFVTYVNDYNLFTPDEMIDLTFQELKSLSTSELIKYMGFNDIFSTADEYSTQIDQAVAEQILKNFDYKIIETSEDGSNAQVTLEITSLSLENVLTHYADSLIVYATTSEAISATPEEKTKQLNKLLLNAIIQNDKQTTATITLSLKDDGTSWNIDLNDSFTDALLGGLSEATSSFNAVLGDK